MNTNVAHAPEPVHVVALSGCHTLAEKVRYACEHNRPDPTAGVVLQWLARYGVHTTADYVTNVVAAWHSENTLPPPSAGRDAFTAKSEPVGVKGFYLVAFMAVLVSIDTSWRFFAQNLNITDLRERVVMFAVLEVALIACGYGMRANVVRCGRPGAPRLVAWVLCGLAAYMAWQLSGVAEGIARVALGPVLGLVMLHLALGIEIRAGQHQATTWARVGRELRERLLSRLGLADDQRDALARTRARAASRAARLALAGRVWCRSGRVVRALRASNVAHDPVARERLLAELAAIQHASELADLNQPSPWYPIGESAVNGAVNTPVGVQDTPGGVFVNDAVAVHGDSGQRRSRTPRKGSRAGRQNGRKPGRKLFADYLADARQAWTPGVVVTPAWVREVTACSRGTSKGVADALNAEIPTDPATEVAA